MEQKDVRTVDDLWQYLEGSVTSKYGAQVWTAFEREGHKLKNFERLSPRDRSVVISKLEESITNSNKREDYGVGAALEDAINDVRDLIANRLIV